MFDPTTFIQGIISNSGINTEDLKKRISSGDESAISDISKMLGVNENQVSQALSQFKKMNQQNNK